MGCETEPTKEERGRLQFFFHSPHSELPIRDVNKPRYKTEPHIEIGAENYINPCRQPDIRAFCDPDRNEEYLFLFTKRNNPGSIDHNKMYIVGYILKQKISCRDCKKSINKNILITIDNECRKQHHLAVIGETRIFKFEDAYDLEKMFPEKLKNNKNPNPWYIPRKLNPYRTETIINHFKEKQTILDECIKKIHELDKENKTCLKEDCSFYKNKSCPRWEIA